MAVDLVGGCRVSAMREGTPHVVGSLSIWNQVGKATGAKAISLRVLEFGVGLSPALRNQDSDEVLYVLEDLDDAAKPKRCTVFIDGRPHRVQTQTGIYLRPGQTLMVDNPGPDAVCFVSSQCPESDSDGVVPLKSVDLVFTDPQGPEPSPIVRLIDQREMPTADRWYRVLVDHDIGSEQVTQFVGSIPPGRAPDHFHEYEEVLFLLRGEGRLWSGDASTPIGPGDCVYLPHGQVHCVENTGEGELRLLGVFYPAGSPAVRYES
ncbi:MAG TPA: cupin domain-containing protein [Pyrinomonadaceae bacterium]|nr:cupin domain-containing protein [Pyrinomonadaceae bacterium]